LPAWSSTLIGTNDNNRTSSAHLRASTHPPSDRSRHGSTFETHAHARTYFDIGRSAQINASGPRERVSRLDDDAGRVADDGGVRQAQIHRWQAPPMNHDAFRDG
jgi:hypothetical protein